MLTVCTSSTETQLAALGDLMAMMNLTASSSGIDKALTDATAWAERHCLGAAGVLRRQVYLETLPGRGSQRLMVSRTPLWKVSRMFDATDTCNATEYCSTDFRIEDVEAGFIEFTSDAGFPWTPVEDFWLTRHPRPAAVRRPWLICYEAGYQLTCTSSTSNDWNTTTTGRTLPEDLERAVLLKAAELYSGSPSGITSMTVGPLSANYSSEAMDPVVELLSQYRRLQ